ncbi:MAG TPA: doxx family protein [Chryseobacterium sp.]|nr:doxx family protein [Chryseobacterium sp.]
MKTLLRYLVSLIFIASGFVKAVDLKGFSFKLEEYFSPVVFNLPFLEKYALAFSIVVVLLELVLGFMLLMKIKLKQTIYALILLCIFFGFLTFYSAYYNVVTDCGCFGDAIKFTPWQSFWKDIILLVLLLILAVTYRKREESSAVRFGRLPLLGVFILIMFFVMYRGIAHEPMIDFRAYAIGTNLAAEKQKIDKNPSEYKTFYSLKNLKTGEVKKVNQDDYINKEYWKDTNWQIEEGKTTSEIVKKGYESEITKFKIEDVNGNNFTDTVLNEPRVVLVFTYKPKDADPELVAKTETKALTEKAKVYGVSTQPDFYKQIPNFQMDEVAIKTIARSNPFVLVLEKGKIIEKLSAKDYLEKE